MTFSFDTYVSDRERGYLLNTFAIIGDILIIISISSSSPKFNQTEQQILYIKNVYRVMNYYYIFIFVRINFNYNFLFFLINVSCNFIQNIYLHNILYLPVYHTDN
ncbi:hypothetical protein HanIR_Chr11g0544851 [Helianthus annuus]|nr:hypothetical protein HanIR_Chr11g0544851 [Helianthus annuus]